ncbi:MAG TPA: hypothetical protein VME46_16790 [Acidimicrobiales bacterium]|nr:hypothetical protein [Acidimicrobiales bacterium]
MPGLSLGANAGVGLNSTQVAPSIAAYGSGASPAGGGTVGTSGTAAKGATAAMTTALVAIGVLWWAQPRGERNRFGTNLFLFGLGFVAFQSIHVWGAAHVAEGDTQGFSGVLYKTAALF